MPVLPPPNTTAYDTVNTVLLMAKARLNDKLVTLAPVSGKILDNTQIFSQVVVNSAWRVCQERLANKGYDRLIDECIIQQFPIVQSQDPASQCWINWRGCWDGVNFYPQPAFPQFFNHPLKIWERWSNQNMAFTDPPMQKILNGLPASQKTTNMRFWEWRSDTLYTPGSQMLTDLRIRHISYISDFLDSGTTPWFAQPVPIMRCSDALSWLICAEIAVARGDNKLADVYTGNGDGALDRIFNLDVEADQQVNIRRQPRTGNGYGRRWY
jgi:hypothetical protein